MTDFNVLTANEVAARNAYQAARTAREAAEKAWYGGTMAIGIPTPPRTSPGINAPFTPAALPVDLNALGHAFAEAATTETGALTAYKNASKALSDARG